MKVKLLGEGITCENLVYPQFSSAYRRRKNLHQQFECCIHVGKVLRLYTALPGFFKQHFRVLSLVVCGWEGSWFQHLY